MSDGEEYGPESGSALMVGAAFVALIVLVMLLAHHLGF